MFQHLVEKNDLDTDFNVYFKEDLNRNIKFIKELIEGLTKDDTKAETEGHKTVHKKFFTIYA